MSDAEDRTEQRSLRNDLARLRRSLAPWRLPLLVILALAAGNAVLEAVIVLCIAAVGAALASGPDAVDRSVLGFEIDWSIRSLCLITLGLVVVRTVTDLVAAWLKARTEAAYDASMRSAVVDAYLSADWALQSEEQAGGLQASLTTYASMARTLMTKTTDLAVSTVSFAIMLAASVTVGGWVTAAVVAAMGVLAFVFRPLVEANRRSSVEQRDATGSFSNRVGELVAASREVRVMGVAAQVRARLAQDIEKLRAANRDSASASYRLVSVHTSVTYVAVALGLTGLVFADVADPQPYAAMVLLLYRAMIYGRGMQSTYQGMAGALPYLEELDARLARYRVARDRRGSDVVDGISEVVFDGVGFRYEQGPSPAADALHGISLTVGRGHAVGIVGPSGSGKSTFVQLLLGLRPPTAGTITVDGRELWAIDAASWARAVSFVPQESMLFDESIIDNVICFRDGITRRDAEEALGAAHVLDELLALPAGLDTVVGAGGRRLSGGQRQRVCIARALAGRPDLLVLDEPTSALDLRSEDAIRETLLGVRDRMGLVIVAHRMSTLRICDRIAVINGGRLEAFAERETLEADNAYFSDAVAMAKLV